MKEGIVRYFKTLSNKKQENYKLGDTSTLNIKFYHKNGTYTISEIVTVNKEDIAN